MTAVWWSTMDTNRCVWKRRRSGLCDSRPSQAYSYGALYVSPEVVIRAYIYNIIYYFLYTYNFYTRTHKYTHLYYIWCYIAIIYCVGTLFSYQATNPTAFQVTDTRQYCCYSGLTKKSPSIIYTLCRYTSQRYTNTRLQNPLPVKTGLNKNRILWGPI